MATQDKLLKSLEILKNLSNHNQTGDLTSRRKEKIHHCRVASEAISNPTIIIAQNFHNLLSYTLEILLKLCNDPDSDVRMIAEECLNRIIRALYDSNISKVQIELHKEIKNNGAARSLRAALVRFAQLSHLIRPCKGKPYVVNILPSIIKITERNEEIIHETLSISLPKIMNVLGCFTSEHEVKDLLKAFLLNVSNKSTVIRRATANCILNICLNCRKPYIFIVYCINSLLDILVPVDENKNSATIVGVMTSLKTLLPYLKKFEETNDTQESFGNKKQQDLNPPVLERLLQIYELCLFYFTSKDHNVINSSLETLNALLQSITPDLKKALLCENGLVKSRITNLHLGGSLLKLKSRSQLSVATASVQGDENLFQDLELELTETVRSDIEKWIDESKLTVMNIAYSKSKDSIEKSQSLDSSSTLSNFSISDIENTDSFDYSNMTLTKVDAYNNCEKNSGLGENLERLTISDNSSEKSFSCVGEDKFLNSDIEDVSEITVGDILDKTVPLVYCARLVAKLFLLNGSPGGLISEKKIRVSVKSLALSCVASIVNICPKAFLIYLDKTYVSGKIANKTVSNQQISDVTLFIKHSDPQLRGVVRILLGNYIKAALIESNYSYAEWLMKNTVAESDVFQFKNLFEELLKGLEDESSNCCRQTLTSLNNCFRFLLESYNCNLVTELLDILPSLAKNPYWLIKVELCETVCNINYITVHHVLGTSEFQNKVVHNVLLELIGDTDQRVRNSAANSIVKIVPNLYHPNFQAMENTTTYKAAQLKHLYLSNLCVDSDDYESILNRKKLTAGMVFPYDKLGVKSDLNNISFSLSQIVSKLTQFVATSTSKYFVYGCMETLSLLLHKYPSTVCPNAWNCFRNSPSKAPSTSVPDILNISINLLTNSVAIYDSNCHINLLDLSSNVYAGNSISVLVPLVDTDNKKPLWSMFSNRKHSELSEQFLNHVVKILNIFHHVLDETQPILPQSKPVLPNLPSASALSPIKRRKSDIDKKIITGGEKDTDKRDTNKGAAVGCFVQSPHYMKVFEILKMGYNNYKTSLDSEVCEKFLNLLKATLHSLSVIMEVGTLNELGRMAEEILSYLKSTFMLESAASVECVQQLLKCLFGTNLTANASEILEEFCKKPPKEEEEDSYGFYNNVLHKPYSDLSSCINSLNKINKVECDSDDTVMGYLHRRICKQTTPHTRSSDKVLANYIRIFEPMVIKSLKQYTITSDVRLQCRVLQLLSQLVQLRVNYCLLDSDQIFIDFVLKQFEFIEEGQIPYSSEIVPKIFQFLVHLSYSKQHSKTIISIPKIIHLCDGLMASGQSPLTHSIPALEPVVEDIFLIRNKSNTADLSELETTREVMLSMLLRQSEYPEVLNLITLILNDSKYYSDSPDKWLRWSQQVANCILTNLKQGKIQLDNSSSFTALRKLIFAVNPNVFKPIDAVLVILFQDPPGFDDSLVVYSRWLGKILILLLILSSVKEDLLLSKISELRADFSPKSVFENVSFTADPLNVTNNANAFQNLSPEEIFIRLLFRIIKTTSKKCVEVSKLQLDTFVMEEFSMFLMYCLYIFQSGSHCKVANVAISLVNKNIPLDGSDPIQIVGINENFLVLAVFHPLLTVEWNHFLTLLNYGDKNYWSKIMSQPELSSQIESKKISTSINFEIVRVGGILAFCDYLSENNINYGELSWILENNIVFIIDNCDEPPVSEFLSSVHRNVKTSGLFVQNVSKQFQYTNDVIYVTNVLKCVENCHSLQTGTLIKFLLPKVLCFKQLAITRQAANLASRKIELLLTMSMEDVNNQLTKENMLSILEQFVSGNLIKRHEALVGLLNKLGTQYYDLTPVELNQRKSVNPEYIKRLQINKQWYLSQIKLKFHDSFIRKKAVAILLNPLNYDELTEILSSREFNKLNYQYCLQYGVDLVKKNDLQEEPVLVKACVNCLLSEVARVRKNRSEKSTPLECQNTKECEDNLSNLIPSVTTFINLLPHFPTLKIPESSYEDLVNFAVSSLEKVNRFISIDNNDFNANYVYTTLRLADEIFKEPNLSVVLGLDCNLQLLFTAVDSIYDLTTFLLHHSEPLPSMPKYCLKSTIYDVETSSAGQTCYKLYILIAWLYKIKNTIVDIPSCLFQSLKSVIVSLAKLPVANSYMLIPTKVWRNGWQPELSGTFHTEVPPIPIELLQDIDVLEEYIFRITLLGWNTRQQFEETWMSLLSVLCNTPTEDTDPNEINDIIHSCSLAVKAITSLLLQTLLHPYPGNPSISKLLHISRDVTLIGENISFKKLKKVHTLFQCCLEESMLPSYNKLFNVFDKPNFEKCDSNYSYGQISIRYFLISSKLAENINNANCEATKRWRKQQTILQQTELDVNSCLQFLVDFYTQLIKNHATTNIRFLHEIVKSTIIISDLFNDKQQFVWMLDIFLELSKVYPIEDELLHQYLIIGICKAAAVLIPELETFETVKKILAQYLKSSFLPSRISCLYGMLYLIEGCSLSNTNIGGISDEMQLLLPVTLEYVAYHFNPANSIVEHSEEHQILVWAITFYVIENVDETYLLNFVKNAFRNAIVLLTQEKIYTNLHTALLKGFERLIIVKKSILGEFDKQILKLAFEKIRNDNPTVSMLGIQLLFSYMYTDCSTHFENTERDSNIQTNPEHLVQTIEKISAIFEHVKKSYNCEVEVICEVLPDILSHFFSPADILTKVISEFLSPQQPHPKLLSKVVFQVFEYAIKQNQLSLLQDWVVFSLSNFTQSLSVGMSTWCLTCFFVSASSNEWLRSLFPYIQTRVGRYEYEDRKMLCIAGSDFYRNLSNPKQKQTFIDNFNKVKDQLDMPFNDLLSSL